MSFRYILRYQIDPDYHADERIEELVDFCVVSRIEEVMLFMTGEELNPGHPTWEQIEPYVEMGKRLKGRLAECGIELSLNPWTTMHHASGGRRLQAGQNFRLMVGETGQSSPVTVCPLCEHWQAYLCDLFGRLCRALDPVAIWVEDDFRLHNHGEELGWGGCFCDEHLRRFGEAVGEAVTREQVLANVLASGRPHPWRDIWLALSRDSLIEPARKLRDACAPTRLALMSSTPDIHSAEGRDWHALQMALGDEPAFMTRPHLPPYTETSPLHTVPSVTRHTIANLKRPLEIYPELESSPRNGPYAKSRAYSVWECLHAAAMGSHGITINHYDMMGGGIALDPPFGEALAEAKTQLDAIVAMGIDDGDAHGVQVLFDPQVSRHAHLTDAKSFEDLAQRTWLWSDTCYILGIAHGFARDIVPGQVHAAGGQTLRAWDDDRIDALLNEAVLLDADSAAILVERGFGERIGVHDAQWRTLDDTAYAYEQVLTPDVRVSAQRCADRLLAMQVNEADVRSWICSAFHQRLWPGLIVHGRAAVLTYPIDGRAQFFMGVFSAFRRELMQNLLFELAPGAALAVAAESPMQVYRAPIAGGILLGVLNPTYDRVDRIALRVGDLPDNVEMQVLANGEWGTASVQREADRLVLDATLGPLEECWLKIYRLTGGGAM